MPWQARGPCAQPTVRASKIGGVQVNFIAEFDIDEGAQTDLALELHEYDTSPSAEYESWMLLEVEPNTTEPGQ